LIPPESAQHRPVRFPSLAVISCKLQSGRLLKTTKPLRHQRRKCDRGLVFKISADNRHVGGGSIGGIGRQCSSGSLSGAKS